MAKEVHENFLIRVFNTNVFIIAFLAMLYQVDVITLPVHIISSYDINLWSLFSVLMVFVTLGLVSLLARKSLVKACFPYL